MARTRQDRGSTLWRWICVVRRGQGRLAEAEKLFREALEMALGIADDDVRLTVPVLSKLAGVRQQQGGAGALAEAEGLLRQAVAVLQQDGGNNGAALAAVSNNLASVLQDQHTTPPYGSRKEEDKLHEAEALYRHAIQCWDDSLGKNSPPSASGLNNLGSLLIAQGRLHDALTTLDRALRILESSVGPSDPRALHTRLTLAVVRWMQGHFDHATELVEGLNQQSDGAGAALCELLRRRSCCPR